MFNIKRKVLKMFLHFQYCISNILMKIIINNLM